jgi:hypothetical protein
MSLQDRGLGTIKQSLGRHRDNFKSYQDDLIVNTVRSVATIIEVIYVLTINTFIMIVSLFIAVILPWSSMIGMAHTLTYSPLPSVMYAGYVSVCVLIGFLIYHHFMYFLSANLNYSDDVSRPVTVSIPADLGQDDKKKPSWYGFIFNKIQSVVIQIKNIIAANSAHIDEFLPSLFGTRYF